MNRLSALALLLLATLTAACGTRTTETAPLVLAASSMQEAMTAAADAWAAEGHTRPVISFAASSALARQIESGVHADIFVSADEEWMDSVEQAGRVQPGTRRDLVGNALVLVAPRLSAGTATGSGTGSVSGEIALDRAALGAAVGDSRLAMADPEAVPAGKYGKAAFEHLGLWPLVRNRIAQGENVRAALALVERGAAPLGVVYATDARASDQVRIAATFPADSHPPILYPLALLRDARPGAGDFADFLASDRGRRIFARFGFVAPSG